MIPVHGQDKGKRGRFMAPLLLILSVVKKQNIINGPLGQGFHDHASIQRSGSFFNYPSTGTLPI
mgnify:CR=1 FL=1